MNVKLMMGIALFLGIVGAASWFYHTGGKAAKLDVVKEQNVELQDAVKRIHELEETIRQQEMDMELAVAAIDEKYQRELTDAKKRTDGFIDDVMSGRLRLWDKGARCGKPAVHFDPTATVPTSVGDGETGAELSEELERFLELEAARADKVVIQLTACQEIIRADRNSPGK